MVALLREDMIHVAWVGDSQAMLFRKGKGIQLVNPHKPDREVAVAPLGSGYTDHTFQRGGHVSLGNFVA